MVRAVAPVAVAVAVVVAAACGGDDAAVRPAEAFPLIGLPEHFHSVSPDGRWVAAAGDGEVCIGSTVELARPECTPSPGSDEVRLAWSPRSDGVVAVPDVRRSPGPAHAVVLDISGHESEIALRTDRDGVPGSAIDVVYEREDRILYLVAHEDPVRLDVRRVGLDGANDELVMVLDQIGDSPVTEPGLVVAGRALHVTIGSGGERALGAWRFQLGSGAAEPLVVGEEARRAGRFTGERTVAAHGDVFVTADLELLSGAPGRDHFQLGSDDGTVTTIDDRDDFRIVGATLSPDGAHLAVIAARVDDTASAGEGTLRASIAPVDSVLAGSPDWQDLEPIPGRVLPPSPRRSISNLVWTDYDRLVVGALEESVLAIEVSRDG